MESHIGGQTVGVVSLGCPKNRVDTEVMLGLMLDAGYTLSPFPEKAQIIIVNTCGFIEAAKQESIDTILEMAAYKQSGKCEKLLVTGCLTQRYMDELVMELPEVDGFLGVNAYADIVPVLEAMQKGTRVTGWEPCTLPMERRILSTPFYTAYVKIAEGCDNRCSYCAIPAIRGRYRSRAIKDVVSECRALAANGVREITLIAQDTTRYAEDIAGRSLLSELLAELNGISALHWIRILYCYPERITEELLQTVAGLPRVCNYLDIPIQHIDADMLRNMNRISTPEQIVDLLSRIRGLNDGFSLRTSLIAGFPGESEEQFGKLCDFIQAHPFDHLGAFAFSPEDGTPAVKLPGAVPKRIRERRRDRLMQIQAAVARETNQKHMGRIYEVLVEGHDQENGVFFGRSAYQAPEIDSNVFFTANEELAPGSFVQVRITEVEEYDWIGEMTDEPAQ